jgi:hypothetical protein
VRDDALLDLVGGLEIGAAIPPEAAPRGTELGVLAAPTLGIAIDELRARWAAAAAPPRLGHLRRRAEDRRCRCR